MDGGGACFEKIDGGGKITQNQKQFKSNVKPQTEVSSLKSHIKDVKMPLVFNINTDTYYNRSIQREAVFLF